MQSKILVVVGVVAIAQWGGDDDTSCSGNVGVYPFTRARCVGGRWRVLGDTICLDVRILDCCFSLRGAGARQHSNCIEGRVSHRRVPLGNLSARSTQSGIAVAPSLPHLLQRMRGPNDGTGTS